MTVSGLDLAREPFVTGHALQRYRLHHPDATWQSLLVDRRRGVAIPPETALAITGRRWEERARRSVYVLAWDRLGIFVDAPPDRPSARRVLVTYLRLGMAQELVALGLYPIEAAPP